MWLFLTSLVERTLSGQFIILWIFNVVQPKALLNALRATVAGRGCHLLRAQAWGQRAEAAARRVLGQSPPRPHLERGPDVASGSAEKQWPALLEI